MANTARTLFVTGGSKGLGAQIVLDSVRAGFDVGFTFLNEDEHAEALIQQAKALNESSRVLAYQLDVRDPDRVEEVVEAAIDEFETIDVVVCNAGITRVGMMFAMSNEDWQDVLETNLSGAFYVCRQFLAHFVSNRFGRFVHISSIANEGMAGQAGYCATKAGLEGLSKAIAKEYGRKGITSNTIVLGLIDGGIARTDASGKAIEYWKQYCPAGRLGEMSEVAHVVHFLGDPSSGFINGAALHVDGGLSESP
ncbi:MAG: SDR family oxidoreductase [Alphaproteobacteria bacterium]|nr:SDR family oxidoreductase [Alphaproteobacteria bacterium]